MAEVNFTKRVLIAGKGLRYCAVDRMNGEYRADWVMFNGKAEEHPEGTFYIEYREDGERIREAVGADIHDALARLYTKKAELKNGSKNRNEQPKSETKNQPEAQTAPAQPKTETQPEQIVEPKQTEPKTPPEWKCLKCQKGYERAPVNGVGEFLPCSEIRDGMKCGGAILPTRLEPAMDYWLSTVKRTKKEATWKAYRATVRVFLKSCKKTYVDELNREDILGFIEFLRGREGKKGKAHPKTVNTKYQTIIGFANSRKLNLVEKGDRPKFTRRRGEDVEIYEQEDLDAMFAACKSYEHLVFQFFLESAFREEEVTHLHWSDINFKRGEVNVNPKPQYNWEAKDYEIRHVPVSDDLINKLKAHKAESNGKCELVFPTLGYKPQTQFLDVLKAIAVRASLDRTKYNLKKFRATTITNWLRSGVADLVTIQHWAGHSDLKTTMAYLRPNDKIDRSKLNGVFKVSKPAASEKAAAAEAAASA